ncbi:FAD-dependent 5-carboxymethylaminomethyl-2-thiouridine(34) oxidoreductase MnmC [Cronobacter sakazakii]|uniref:FAD-dependent 5-carboxymethylaminomethyl-2-thiouridine(34) oxidoreductase MnmC n=1 Tax=Cronobacter sakazakii TaxID=28141 RepID=UPI0021AB62A4|nr:FAD-dependent 5-carboxymethylaminomethyl-2-thiouridine(34) oxidoreductase MnmC [Cronobacter sakazakii]
MHVHATLDPLEWESHFFGIDSAIVRFSDTAPQLDVAQLDAWSRVQAKVPAARCDLLDGLAQLGFQLVEGEVDFALTLTPDAPARDAQITTATPDDIPLLRDAAAEAFAMSRFRAPWYARRPASGDKDVAIIGGGIASSLLALGLLRRGWQVTLYCEDDAPAQGASGNRQGALYPLLSHHDAALAAFFPAAFTFARRLYDALPVSFDKDWCGVTQLGWDEKSQTKINQMLELALPDTLARGVDAREVRERCGVETGCGGIEYPQGGWLCPAQLTAGVLELAQAHGLRVHYGHRVSALHREDLDWQLDFANGAQARHAAVVLANGHQLSGFPQTEKLPVYPVGGQVSHIPTTPGLGALRQVLCYDGYLTPQNPANAMHCIGASYHRGVSEMCYQEEDQQRNRQRLLDCLPAASWAQEVDVSAGDARCGVRCATRDHLPMVGNAPDYATTLRDYATLSQDASAPETVMPAPVLKNLFVLGALGSRGLCSAPLAAEILASQMSGEPLPLDGATLAALNPNRLWVRKLLKGRAAG